MGHVLLTWARRHELRLPCGRGHILEPRGWREVSISLWDLHLKRCLRLGLEKRCLGIDGYRGLCLHLVCKGLLSIILLRLHCGGILN